ncbi:MAG: cation transporter [Candidatus Binatia bacterium]
MKTLPALAFASAFLLAATPLVAAAQSTAPPGRRYVARIAGLHCAPCVQQIREALTALPDVERVDINYTERTATLIAKPGRSLSRNSVETPLQGLGYGVTTFDEQPPQAAGS